MNISLSKRTSLLTFGKEEYCTSWKKYWNGNDFYVFTGVCYTKIKQLRKFMTLLTVTFGVNSRQYKVYWKGQSKAKECHKKSLNGYKPWNCLISVKWQYKTWLIIKSCWKVVPSTFRFLSKSNMYVIYPLHDWCKFHVILYLNITEI